MRFAVVLVALWACKMNDPKPTHTEVASPPTCGSAGPSLALQDDASIKLVTDAKPGGPGTIEITPINKPDYGCNTGGFDGWEATARITGGDHELVGIVSYPPATVPLARGANDEWVTFRVGDPGYGHELHVGAIWRKKGDPTPIVAGAAIPTRPAPLPPPHPRYQPEIGCDPAGPGPELGPPLNADHAIHVGFATLPKERPLPSRAELAVWLDKDIPSDPPQVPLVTTELGTVTRAPAAWDSINRTVVFTLDARCPDLRVLPRKFTVDVSWTHAYTTKIVLEQKADGSIARSGS